MLHGWGVRGSLALLGPRTKPVLGKVEFTVRVIEGGHVEPSVWKDDKTPDLPSLEAIIILKIAMKLVPDTPPNSQSTGRPRSLC